MDEGSILRRECISRKCKSATGSRQNRPNSLAQQYLDWSQTFNDPNIASACEEVFDDPFTVGIPLRQWLPDCEQWADEIKV